MAEALRADGGPGWCLAIEASNPSGGGAGSGPSVALVPREGPAVVEAIASPGGRHDDDLMPAIDRLVRRSGVGRRGIERVAVSAGPGGFSGLRVACVTGQMLSLALGASAVRVPTAAASAMASVRAGDVRRGAAVAVVLAGKGERAHVSLVRAGDGVAEEAGTVDAAGFVAAASGAEAVLADGHAPAGFELAGVRRVGLRFEAASVGELGWVLAPTDAAGLVPIYGREPEAVTRWRERFGRAPGDGGAGAG